MYRGKPSGAGGKPRHHCRDAARDPRVDQGLEPGRADGEELRAGVEHRFTDALGREAATDPRRLLEHLHVDAVLDEPASAEKPADARADHDNAHQRRSYRFASTRPARQGWSPVARVLVTEEIADGGLELLARQAGHDVDVQARAVARELLEVVPGAHALVIRSATKVTAEVLQAGADLVVVGRAGIGLDNVDVEAATARGVMVVNAPQSNILSAAEHTMALLLAQARNIPQAHAALKEGRWERSRWEGVELADKMLGRRRPRPDRQARRAAGPGVRDAAARLRPLRLSRAGAPDRRRAGRSPSSWPRADFVTIHVPKTAETVGLIGTELLGHGQARRPHHQRRPRRHRRRGRARVGDHRGHRRRRRARRVRRGAHDRVAAVRARQRRRHPSPRREHTRGAGQGGRHDRRAGAARPRRRVRAVRRQRERGRGVRDRAAVPAAGRAARPAVRRAQRGRARPRSRSSTRASSPTTTPASSRCRC